MKRIAHESLLKLVMGELPATGMTGKASSNEARRGRSCELRRQRSSVLPTDQSLRGSTLPRPAGPMAAGNRGLRHRSRAGPPHKQRPEAHCRSFSTDSAAVRATGTTFWAAAVSGTSSSAANRQQALISAPVQSASSGGSFCWHRGRNCSR